MSVEALEGIAAAIRARDEQRHEYGQYVALGPIDVGGVRAYNTGDPVPASNVELHGYHTDGLVAPPDSPEGRKARGAEEPAPLERPRDSGSLADWQAYAAQEGAHESVVATATRDELVALFPKTEG